MTADGRGLYCGHLHPPARRDDRRVRPAGPRGLAPRRSIREGDMFFTNDPWWGRCTPTTGSSRCRSSGEGELVAWSGIVMHDDDVGSPVPGSFVSGADGPLRRGAALPRDEDGRGLRAARRRRARLPAQRRTPELNALNMRARVAALRIDPPADPRADRAVRPRRVPRGAGGDHRVRRAGRALAPARDPRRRVVRDRSTTTTTATQRRDVPDAACAVTKTATASSST